MKIKFIIPVLLVGLFIVSCNKDKKTASTPLVFSSLKAVADSVKVDSLLQVRAVATGDNVSYTWESDGNIVGSGSNVNFTICHASTFYIKCTVTDAAANTDSKTISVKSFTP